MTFRLLILVTERGVFQISERGKAWGRGDLGKEMYHHQFTVSMSN